MALFHIVPRVIFKINSKMGCRAHYKFLKCLRTPWDHFWVGIIEEMKLGFSHLNYKSFSDEQDSKFKLILHNLYFASLKLVRHSIINCLHSCLRSHPKHSMQGHALYPFWEESAQCHFDKVAFCIKLVLEPCTCSLLIIYVSYQTYYTFLSKHLSRTSS